MEAHRPSRRVAACAEFPNDNPALHRGAIWCCDEIGQGAVCQPAIAMQEVVTWAVTEPTPTEPLVLAVDRLALDVLHEAEEVDEAPPAPLPGPSDDVRVVGEPSNVSIPPDAHVEDADEAHTSIDDGDADGIEVVDELVFDGALLDEPAGDDATLDEPASDHALLDEPAADDALLDPPATAEDPFATLVRLIEEVARAAGCGEETVGCLRALLGRARLEGDLVPESAADALLAAGMIARSERGLVRSETFAGQVAAWQGVLRGESEDFGACGAAMLDEWCANVVAHAMGHAARAEGLRRELRRRGVAAFGLVADAA